MSKRRVHLCVTGLVQGVYYRLTMQKTAALHGVTGWVRNLENGSVEAVIEGESENIGRIIEWCSRGPDEARVDDVELKEQEVTGEFTSFDIQN